MPENAFTAPFSLTLKETTLSEVCVCGGGGGV